VGVCLDIHIRPANFNDKDLLFAWFNNKDSLKFKIKTESKISIAEHEKWFVHRLTDNNTYIWIIENKKKESIGQIRFEKSIDEYYDIDIFVIKDVRKKGVASKALLQAEKLSKIKLLRAVIKKNNYLSYLFFTRNFYEISHEDTNCWTLVKVR